MRLANRKLPGTRLNPRTQLYPGTQFHPIVQFHPRTGLNPRPQFNPIVQFIPGTRFAQRSLTASVLWFDRVVPSTLSKALPCLRDLFEKPEINIRYKASPGEELIINKIFVEKYWLVLRQVLNLTLVNSDNLNFDQNTPCQTVYQRSPLLTPVENIQWKEYFVKSALAIVVSTARVFFASTVYHEVISIDLL